MKNLEKEIRFISGNGTELFGKFIFPNESNTKFPLVVILTGDGEKGSKSSSWTNILPMFVAREIAIFIFDFEGLGMSKGERKNLSLTIGLDNIKKAMEQIYYEKKIDKNKIGLLGSSFGGNVAVLYTAIDNNIKALGLKSPVSFYPDSFISEFGKSNVIRWITNKSNDLIDFKYNFYIDSFRYNTYSSAMQIKCPCKIIHGDADEVVPITQSIHLNAALNTSTESTLKILKDVGHRYSEEGSWENMAQTLTQWFNEKLKN